MQGLYFDSGWSGLLGLLLSPMSKVNPQTDKVSPLKTPGWKKDQKPGARAVRLPLCLLSKSAFPPQASEAQTWDPEQRLTAWLPPLPPRGPATVPVWAASHVPQPRPELPGARWESEVCAPGSLFSGRCKGSVGAEEAPGEGDGTRSQPSPFYISVKVLIKWYIINDMTALEDTVNLFRNVRSHFITALSRGTTH